MKRLPALVLAAALACGCGAELGERRAKKSGPVKEVGLIDAGGGQVKYSLKGAEFLKKSRRKDAFAKMTEACGGADRFRIVDEVAREEVGATYKAEELEASAAYKKSLHYATEMYQHIFFECSK